MEPPRWLWRNKKNIYLHTFFLSAAMKNNTSDKRNSMLPVYIFLVTPYKLITAYLGPVVQSIVSLLSSLVVKILTVLLSTVSNSQVFLLKKCE